jgi:hypothetical protein
MNLSI